MHRWPAATAAVALTITLAGCSGTPAPIPTIGSPAPSTSPSATVADRGAQLAREWELTGAELPEDWPDVPVPRGTDVTAAYAIGVEPRRTWTATFTADRGTALDLAEPVVAELRRRGYVPISEYVGEASTNTGLYSFAAPSFAVYVVLGEDDGRPNVVITVRGSTDPSAGLPSDLTTLAPTAAPAASGSATGFPTPTASPRAGRTPTTSPTATEPTP